MGQKVSPIGMRVGVIRDWESRWYSDKEYGTLLNEDIKIRDYIFGKLNPIKAAVSHIEIERSKNAVNVVIKTAKPGAVHGTDHQTINELVKGLIKLTGGKKIHVDVVEIANPDLDAKLVARSIADQIEERASFRTAQKRAIQKTMRAGAKGIKTLISGRLGGADIARGEGYSEGVVPLHTIRADVDFAIENAKTTYGILGVKVWICRGEVMKGEMVKDPEAPKFGGSRTNDRRRNRNDRPRREEKQSAPQTETKEVTENVNA